MRNKNPRQPAFDPNGATQPYSPAGIDPLSRTTPTSIYQQPRKRSPVLGCGCLSLLLGLVLLLGAYFLLPLRTNLLLLGADRTSGAEIGRSDTIILMTVVPSRPTVGMLSIPRDLWVPIPGHGENRINTAHFFAEVDQPGSGPKAAIDVIQDNFGVRIPYYVRIQFSGLKDVVEAMGGVTLELSEPAAGLAAGTHVLNGDQALAFARERKSSDDFFRMAHGQLLIKAIWKQMLQPASWPRIPAVAVAFSSVVTTNLPVWEWPRLGLAFVRAGPDGIDSRTIDREMVTPFTTSGGAMVLAPNWEKINPVISEMFGAR